MKFTKLFGFFMATVLIASGLSTACSNRITREDVREKVAEAESAQVEAQRKTKEAVSTVIAYDEQEIRSKLKKYGPQIRQLETQVEAAASQPEVQAKLKEVIAATHKHRAEVYEKLEALQEAKGEAVTDLQSKVTVAMKSLEEQLQKGQQLPKQSS